MRILELGKFYPPYHGGMETLLKSWAEGFTRQGATVDCVVSNVRARTECEEISGVRVHRMASLGTLWSVSLCPGYVLSTRRHRADVWHAHFPNPLADLACLAGPRRTPLVLHYHSDVVRQAAALRLYAPLLRWVLGRAARIVVASPQHIEFSPWLASRRAQCEIVPFGINLERFKLTAAVAEAAARLRAGVGQRTILLNIGRLVPYKGQRYLIEAARELDAVVWLVGDGPLRLELEAVARQAGVSDRVIFWGGVDERQLTAMLHACDVFVLPSITVNEAFGLVQVEAMASGKPVVCCALRSGVPFVNQHGVTGLVTPPADASALATALRRLTSDPPLRATFGAAARRRAETEFEESVMIKRYWSVFERLMATARTR
jgi:rhamnosyl/mannosyltransferase